MVVYITGSSMERMMSKRSKVHPTYKTKYRVTNWPEYDRALVRRGDLTIWFTPSAIRTWTPLPTGQRGGQPRYSDPCIELALTLKLLFGLPWRSVEGFLASLLNLVGIDAPTPDHTTLSRRTRGLDVQRRRPSNGGPVHLVVDATGLGIVGQGQWAAAKWGERGRRGWRKLHVAVGEDGGILAVELTDASVADATALPGLLDEVPHRVKRQPVGYRFMHQRHSRAHRLHRAHGIGLPLLSLFIGSRCGRRTPSHIAGPDPPEPDATPVVRP